MSRLLEALRRRPTLALDALKYLVALLTALGITVNPEVVAPIGALLLIGLSIYSDALVEGQKEQALQTPPPAPSDQI